MGKIVKGIILAGGAGNRLYPLTKIQTKQLQPVYDKPMIYYPLSLLMLCGITEILLITTKADLSAFQSLLQDGERIGLKISYKVQPSPKGIAEAFVLGEDFIGDDDVALILGDNIFYGDFQGFRDAVKNQTEKSDGLKARVFAHKVSDPKRYGVVEFDKKSKKVISIEEKPKNPKSDYVIPGLYFLDHSCVEKAKNQMPSDRGELEITDLLCSYLAEKTLGVEILTRGMAWFDTGTHQSLLEASSFIGAIEQRQGLKVACLEEIALRMGYIDSEKMKLLIEDIPNCTYRDYLKIALQDWASK